MGVSNRNKNGHVTIHRVYSKGIYSFSAPTLGSEKISPGVFLQISGRCLTSRTSENPLDEGLLAVTFGPPKPSIFFSQQKVEPRIFHKASSLSHLWQLLLDLSADMSQSHP